MLLAASVDVSGMARLGSPARGESRHGRFVTVGTPILAVAVLLVVGLSLLAALRPGHGRSSSRASARIARSAPASTVSIITPAAARQVLLRVWAMRELARTTDNKRALAKLDTGVELKRDMGVTFIANGEGEWSQRARRPLGRSALVVSHQSSFPASFLAIVETTNQWARSQSSHTPAAGRYTTLLVFTKTSAAAPWRVAMETDYEGTFARNPAREDLGVSASTSAYAPPAPNTRLKASTALTLLANLYNNYATLGNGGGESAFAPSYWTIGQGRRIAADGLNDQINVHGYRNNVRYSFDQVDGAYQFNVGDEDLTCGTVRGEDLATPASANGYVNQTRDRKNWGGELAPGAYSQITILIVHQVCLFIGPHVGFRGIPALSGDDDNASWNVTGTPIYERPSKVLPA
jgi:hypothetical protein